MDRRQFLKAYLGSVALAALPIPALAEEDMSEVLLDAVCRDGLPTALHLYDERGDCVAVFGLPSPPPAHLGKIDFDLPGPLTLEATEYVIVTRFAIVQGDDVLIHGRWRDGPYQLWPRDSLHITAVKIDAAR